MTPDDRSVLAGELALGLLDGDERAAALRLVLSDHDFARQVETWRLHFATLFAEWPEAAPGDGVARRLHTPEGGGGRRWWVVATAALSVIAACLVLALVLRPEIIVMAPAPPAPAPAAPLVAAITPSDAKAKPFGAVYDSVRGEVRLAGLPAVPAGRSAELWTIGGDGVPHSVGIIAGTPRLVVAPAARPRFVAGTVLAISIEPAGGSPTGLPTGPVVATGALAGV